MTHQVCLPGPIGNMAPRRCVDCGKEISPGAKRCQKCNLQSEEFKHKHRQAITSPEYRRKQSASIKAAHARGAYDNVRSCVFQSPTSIERMVANALDELGIEHQIQFRPNECSYTYDEFIPPGTLIEINGDYWHSIKKSQERDTRKAAWAKEHGFCLVVIWEHEIKEQGALALVKERALTSIEGVSPHGAGCDRGAAGNGAWKGLLHASVGATYSVDGTGRATATVLE